MSTLPVHVLLKFQCFYILFVAGHQDGVIKGTTCARTKQLCVQTKSWVDEFEGNLAHDLDLVDDPKKGIYLY